MDGHWSSGYSLSIRSLWSSHAPHTRTPQGAIALTGHAHSVERREPANSASTGKDRIAFVDIGRTLAALLVVYSHIPGRNPADVGPGEHTGYLDFTEMFSSEPLHLAKQGLGQVAVPFFFLVSGFVVTPIALRQGQAKFAINRLLRIYAPLTFVVLLTTFAFLVGLQPPSTGQSQELTPLTVLTNITTANYLIHPQVVLVPVAWTMIVEVLFYLMLLTVVPLLRRSVWLAIAVELTFVFIVLMSKSELNASYSLFADNVSYLPILLTGQIVWASTTGKIPLWAGGIFGGIAWWLYVLAGNVGIHRLDNSYNLAFMIAILCFLLGMFAEDRLAQHTFWTALSERTYSIYLLHGLCLFVVLRALPEEIPFTIGLLVALIVTALLVEVSYRFVEAPSHKLARRLSRIRKRVPRDRPTETVSTESEQTAVSLPATEGEVTEEFATVRDSRGESQREPDHG